jgi:phosphoribosyl 1,2-cyclic phosphodiesterase|tara:strand:- start:111 stop:872 length:762 start_codon:yes stop_codon:yes gene_type:complete
MRFASLGSGSKGNSTIIEAGSTVVLVDCGFGIRSLTTRLLARNVVPEQITAILITHEHSDHWKGVEVLSAKFNIPVYLSAGCFKARNISVDSKNFHIIDSHTDFVVGDLNVTPVPVPHDAREPVQYVFTDGMVRLGILTDLGHYTPHVISVYSQCHGLLLEANYDEEMLAMGPYPRFLKDRVSGLFGHLSNRQALDLLKKLDLSYLQRLLLGHISDKNNHTNIISELLSTADLGGTAITFADQDVGSDWQELG